MWTITFFVKRMALLCLFLLPAPLAVAHVSEMGLVLLLPTDVYITAGVWAVALTLAALILIPAPVMERLFTSLRITGLSLPGPMWTSLISASLFLAVLAIGTTGTRDPLSNPLPLLIWTVWWIILMLVQSVIGNLWHWINPWTGPLQLISGGAPPVFRLPTVLGHWPGLLILVVFTSFALADPAPDDPSRLALIAGAYWAVTLAAGLLWGPAWFERCEFVTMLMRLMATMAPFGTTDGAFRTGVPGWRLLAMPVSLSAGAFALAFLAIGSVDGLNETFWWLGFIEVNPLEFPGRSAIIFETVAGLIAVIGLLFLVFTMAVLIGLRMAKATVALRDAFAVLAPTVLPIAVAYHFAHYLTTTLVNIQYVRAAMTDPLGRGADYLNLGAVYVTTGFLNTKDSVELIFQSQAGAVVTGHVLSVILAHGVATRLFGNRKQAAISQIPLALFMLAYTFLGLWLLAAPKGA